MAQRSADPYATLGVSRNASAERVAQAYRSLAKRYHPDLHPDGGTAERMRRINEAWRVLSNPARRARYDSANPLQRPAGSSHWAPRTRQNVWPGATSSQAWTTGASRTASQTRTSWGPATERPGEMWRRRSAGEAPFSGGGSAQPEQVPRPFQETGWAARIVGVTMVLLFFGAIYAGSLP
jgi:curved DNA-binding protein CbpA